MTALADLQEAYGLAVMHGSAAYLSVLEPERDLYQQAIADARSVKGGELSRRVITRWMDAQDAAAAAWHLVVDGPEAAVKAALAARDRQQ